MNYSRQSNRNRKKTSKQRAKKSRNKIGVLLFRVFISLMIIAGFGAAGLGMGVYMGIIENADVFDDYRAVLPEDSISIVFDRHGNEIERLIGTENREFVTLDEIPLHMQQAIVAIEDERFFYHNGIDIRSIARALYQTAIGTQQGGSTITQQLIKMSRGLQANDLESKLQEQYMAVRFEQLLTEQLGSREAAKYYILEAYLNSIPMHHNISGVQAAAHFYFGGTDISDISLAQAAVLAGITNRPTFYAPTINPENNKRRAERVLDNMLRLEFISEREFNQAIRELDTLYDNITQFRPSAAGTITAGGQHIQSWFVDALIEQLIEDLMAMGYTRPTASHRVFNGGLRIYTTLDMDMQRIMDEVFLDDSFFPQRDFYIDVTYFISIRNNITGQMYHFEENVQVNNVYEKEAFLEATRAELLTANMTLVADRYIAHAQPQAAMIIIDQHTGFVRAVIGGRGEKTTNRAFCRATQATRQPGSVFKVPAAFAPAIDLGLMGVSTVLRDEPFSVDMGGGHTYTPNNWWGASWRGPVTVRQAIYDSMNVVSVRTLVETGIDAAFDYLLNMGFTTLVDNETRQGRGFSDRVPSLALGGLTDGITQLEVTASYALMANGGIYRRPMFYTRVYDHQGNVLLTYDLDRDSRVVLRSTTAYMLTDAMRDTLTRGTGTQARFRNLNMPTAGKTGTSQNTRDLTFVGYTAHLTAGIWLGHDNYNVLTERGNPHLVIWRTVMERIHTELEFPFKDFQRPTGFAEITVCRDSGLRAVPGLCNSDIRGSRAATDFFAADLTGGRYCDMHTRVTIDTFTGRLADSQTPYHRRRVIVGIIVPDEEAAEEGGVHRIPASMAAGNTSVRINYDFVVETPPPEEGGEWEINPDTGDAVFVPNEPEVDDINEEIPEDADTTDPPSILNLFPNIVLPGQVPQQQPPNTVIPEAPPPTLLDNEPDPNDEAPSVDDDSDGDGDDDDD